MPLELVGALGRAAQRRFEPGDSFRRLLRRCLGRRLRRVCRLLGLLRLRLDRCRALALCRERPLELCRPRVEALGQLRSRLSDPVDLLLKLCLAPFEFDRSRFGCAGTLALGARLPGDGLDRPLPLAKLDHRRVSGGRGLGEVCRQPLELALQVAASALGFARPCLGGLACLERGGQPRLGESLGLGVIAGLGAGTSSSAVASSRVVCRSAAAASRVRSSASAARVRSSSRARAAACSCDSARCTSASRSATARLNSSRASRSRSSRSLSSALASPAAARSASSAAIRPSVCAWASESCAISCSASARRSRSACSRRSSSLIAWRLASARRSASSRRRRSSSSSVRSSRRLLGCPSGAAGAAGRRGRLVVGEGRLTTAPETSSANETPGCWSSAWGAE